ncbi:hypothetical protein SteCoe_9936 [Stentor coeruleus]|uniref:Uncharacterized protein n=1 Tax=Stentor coeruleus TaxID=5963 RepID=A0A1R2CGP9_9CILI|nr:hypothetical protein SteCoe_9936 [Stentor coeruleus]
MSKQADFLKVSESVHRRTYSNNIDDIKGLKVGHRRTMSNTAFDFAKFNIQSLPVAKEEPKTPESIESPHKHTVQKKKKGFLSLLNAAMSYFNQEAQFPIKFPPSELDILKSQLEKLTITYKELEESNNKLNDDCDKVKKNIDKQNQNKKTLEASVNELKKYTQQLESNLKKNYSELKIEQKRSEELVFNVAEHEKIRMSPQNLGTDDSDRKLKRKNTDIDKPAPRPINYKPITQRGIRNSRDVRKK